MRAIIFAFIGCISVVSTTGAAPSQDSYDPLSLNEQAAGHIA